jgi:aspartate aminotransferase
MSMDFADRVQRVSPSATISIGNTASALEADGVDVVDLSVGEPDFPTPENVIEAGKEAIDAGHTGYAPSPGVPALREEIADKLRADGLDYGAENVMVTPGGKQALYEIFQTIVDYGDEAVLLDPAWVSYEAMTKLAGGSLSRVDLAPHGFALEPALDDLVETVSDDTTLLVVNSPSNPTGAVYSDAALEGVRDLAVDHDFTVISDEIYKEVTYGTEATSLGSLSGMADRTVTLNGFSKAYSMTGWRLGYFAGPEELISQAGKLQSHSVTCATHFVQYAGIEALRNTDDAVTEMREAFRERRDLLCNLLADRGIDVPKPEGAFYLMIPVADDDQSWCERAIEEAHVATVPGSAFGAPGYARISYAASADRLEEAVSRFDDERLL